MDILIIILAVYGLFLIPTLMGAGIADAVKGSGKKSVNTRTKEEEWADEVKRREMLVRQAKESGKDITKCGGYIAWLYNHRQEEEEE